MQEKKIEKILERMEKEIKVLERKIKNEKLINLKISFVKNLKIFKTTISLAAPYVLCATMLIGISKGAGLGYPFKTGDLVSKKLNVMKEYDSFGNIRYEEQHEYYVNDDNCLKHYSTWQKEDNNLYSREIRTYKLDSISEEEISNLLKKESLKFEDFPLELVSIVKEKKNSINDEEMNKPAHYTVITYNQDDSKFIFREETNEENLVLTLLYILITALSGIISDYFRRKYNNFSFSNSIEAINEKYKPVDMEELQEKLKIKKLNYDRLVK